MVTQGKFEYLFEKTEILRSFIIHNYFNVSITNLQWEVKTEQIKEKFVSVTVCLIKNMNHTLLDFKDNGVYKIFKNIYEQAIKNTK